MNQYTGRKNSKMSTKIPYSFKISFKSRAGYDYYIKYKYKYYNKYICICTPIYTKLHTHICICIKQSLENVLPTDLNFQKILKEVFKLKENSRRNLDLH